MSALDASPAIFAREARRVLRRLEPTGMELRPAASAAAALYSPRNRYAKPVMRIDAATVEALRAHGLIAPGDLKADEETLVITAEGRAFLRRAEAPGEPFRAQHQLTAWRARLPGDESSPPVRVNAGESPLGWLARRRGSDGRALLSAAEVEAGERLREDYTRAQLMARVTVDWERPLSGSGRSGPGADTLGEGALAARRRVSAALTAVGPGLSDVLIAVCCHLEGLEDIERAQGWPARAGKVVLRLALDRLVTHYGLTRGGRARGARAWQAKAPPDPQYTEARTDDDTKAPTVASPRR